MCASVYQEGEQASADHDCHLLADYRVVKGRSVFLRLSVLKHIYEKKACIVQRNAARAFLLAHIRSEEAQKG